MMAIEERTPARVNGPPSMMAQWQTPAGPAIAEPPRQSTAIETKPRGG